MVWAILIAIGILVAVAAFFVYVLYRIFRNVFARQADQSGLTYAIPKGEQYQEHREEMIALIRDLDEVPFTRIEAVSADGTKLSARYYEGRADMPAAICFHGYRSDPVRDFAGGVRVLRDLGCPVILVDQRGMHESGGRYVTFGVREKIDCNAWIRRAAQLFGSTRPVILCGISMGGATVLLAAEEELPCQVKGAIADCPFSSGERIIREYVKKHGWKDYVNRLIARAARLFGRFDLKDADVLAGASRIRIPVLLIHGEEDRFVSCEHSVRLQKANPERIRLELFPGAAHGISYIADPQRYADLIGEFVMKYGKTDGTEVTGS